MTPTSSHLLLRRRRAVPMAGGVAAAAALLLFITTTAPCDGAAGSNAAASTAAAFSPSQYHRQHSFQPATRTTGHFCRQHIGHGARQQPRIASPLPTSRCLHRQVHPFKKTNINSKGGSGGISSSTTTTSLSALPVGIALTFATNLKSGPYGILALAGIAATVLLPITQIRNLFGITLGYGLSVAAMGFILDSTFHPGIATAGGALTATTIAYGVRLAMYLYLRKVAGYRPANSVPQREDPPRLKRVPFSLSLALFYAFMTCPVLYVLRAQQSLLLEQLWRRCLAWIGTATAIAGALLEAVADAQKFVVKLKLAEDNNTDTREFLGPTGGTFKLTRHPNYTGEVAFWSGLFLAGASGFDRSIVGWACASCGLYGIVTIMRTASRNLERRQHEKYGGQEPYEKWTRAVKAPLIPFLVSASPASSSSSSSGDDGKNSLEEESTEKNDE